LKLIADALRVIGAVVSCTIVESVAVGDEIDIDKVFEHVIVGAQLLDQVVAGFTMECLIVDCQLDFTWRFGRKKLANSVGFL